MVSALRGSTVYMYIYVYIMHFMLYRLFDSLFLVQCTCISTVLFTCTIHVYSLLSLSPSLWRVDSECGRVGGGTVLSGALFSHTRSPVVCVCVVVCVHVCIAVH